MMFQRALAMTVALTLPSAFVSTARADEPTPVDATAPRPKPTATRWYGAPTLVVDSLAIASVFAGSLSVRNPKPFVLAPWAVIEEMQPARYDRVQYAQYSPSARAMILGGCATYLLSGPINHLFHGKPRRAAGSFGIRFGAPGVGAVFGLLLGALATIPTIRKESCGESGTSSCLDASDVPITAGVVGGSLVGAVGASFFDSLVLAKEKVPTEDAGSTIAPTITATPGGGIVGFRGLL